MNIDGSEDGSVGTKMRKQRKRKGISENGAVKQHKALIGRQQRQHVQLSALEDESELGDSGLQRRGRVRRVEQYEACQHHVPQSELELAQQ